MMGIDGPLASGLKKINKKPDSRVYFPQSTRGGSYTQIGCAVRFRFEAKRSENEAKNFSLRSEKKDVFSLVSL
jgi:hypothetical protein